jgi:hypothetical protein
VGDKKFWLGKTSAVGRCTTLNPNFIVRRQLLQPSARESNASSKIRLSRLPIAARKAATGALV